MTGNGSTRTRLVYLDSFAADDAGPAVVGAKAANLMRMSDAGLPVPPGFTLSTGICHEYLSNGGHIGPRVEELLATGIRHIEESTGRRYGATRRPLLVSVRSGAAVSMPGMLDTFLDVGLSARTVPALLRATGDPMFVWDSYRRVVATFTELVAGCPAAQVERTVAEVMGRHGDGPREEMDVAALKDVVDRLLLLFAAHRRKPFPEPEAQLTDAVEAVIRSWWSDRAVAYRRIEGLPEAGGTAVTVQAMVFGNLGTWSGSGVGFTRDPAGGANRLYVDFMLNAQGEDVVAGRSPAGQADGAVTALPDLPGELDGVRRTLEATFRDAQDFEFTVEEGKLWILQCRPAKRTPLAALQIACDLVGEGLIGPETALERLRGYDLGSIKRTTLLRPGGQQPLARATPAGVGVASGRIALDVPTALDMADQGSPVVLVRPSASTDDIAALPRCRGLLTAGGARTSHAAVVARQLGVVCLVGCPGLVFDLHRREALVGGHGLAEGDLVTLDANSGDVYAGQVRQVAEAPNELLDQVRAWQGRTGAAGAAGAAAPAAS